MDARRQQHLDEELELIEAARSNQGLERAEGIVTSQDAAVVRMREHLRVGTPFAGFDRLLLPFRLGRGDASIVTAEPDSVTDAHSHRSDALHVVMSGSIVIEGRELGPGEWVHVPAGVEYSMRAGPSGAVVFYPHWT